jgi:uncharacterized OB-fold protein
MVMRCSSCGYWIHPPSPVCPRCYTGDIRSEPVSGDATVYTFTLNYQRWSAEQVVPYVIAIVELIEQDGLRLTTNIVGCPPESVRIGMAVRVVFEHVADVWVPLFAPIGMAL